MNLELNVLDIGTKSYGDAWKIQKELFEKRLKDEIKDTLILVEHSPPAITFGADSKWNILHVPIETLKNKGIEFFRSSRGGGAAYLGPGQLIGYTIMDIKPYGGVYNFMRMLEEVMIRTAKEFGINVDRYDSMNPTTEKPYRATWYKEDGNTYVLCTKGIGSRLYNGGLYTHHGFCLNVRRNDSYFDLIDPCGFPSKEVRPISMEEIAKKKIAIRDIKKAVINNFKDIFKKGD